MDHLLGKAMDKSFWEDVRTKDCFSKYRQELLSQWESKVEGKNMPTLKYSDFKLFWTTGNRKIYESGYFERRQALSAAALLALIYPEEEKYIDRTMDLLYTLCEEYTWCLPAHHKVLDGLDPIRIDLFAAETGFALAEIYTMLEDRLDPLIKRMVKDEIDRRIIYSFINTDTHFYSRESGKTNWTAVCMGSVGCTFMLMRPELVAAMKPRFDYAMECYLSGFNDDGICLEGCGYWHYGFGFFTVYADMIRKYTNGATDYFKYEKVKNIACFIQNVFLSESSCVSFSDGGRTCAYHLGLCHYLKDEYPSDVVVFSPKYSYNYDHCARFCLHLRSAIWLNENYLSDESPDQIGESFSPVSEWFVKRTSNYGFAAKGGHNGEPHNHNDVGSFIFAKNGEQMIMDLGPGVYTRQYFSNERYKFLEADSRGHSLPIINGTYQSTGVDFKARDCRFENGVLSMDLAGAYEIDGLKSIRRSFSFTDDSVTLTDDFSYSGEGDIIERIVSFHPITLMSEGKVAIKDAIVTYDPSKYEVKTESEKCLFRDAVANYLDFKLKDGVFNFNITIK